MGAGDKGRRAQPVVLLVDDSHDNRSMYAEYLAFDGFLVLEANNGVQAIATIRSESPDVVVMDLGIPAIDGVEATRILRADPSTKHVIVLALTGHAGDMEERATAAGVDRYVRKPCLPNDLAVHVRELLAARDA